MDTYFFAHMEEIDFCWRLQLLGYSIYVCPASEVYHVGGGTLPKGNERKVFLNFRNNMIMLAKNLPKRQSFWKIPLRILMDFISAFKSFLQGNLFIFWRWEKRIWPSSKWLIFKRKESVFPVQAQGAFVWLVPCIVWPGSILYWGRKDLMKLWSQKMIF